MKTVLHRAEIDDQGNVQLVSKLLKHNANPNTKELNGWTRAPFHFAVKFSTGKNRISKLNLLLQAGADVNAMSNNGQTPLHCATAVISGHDDCIDFLLGVSDVNLNVLDKKGKTVLDLAFEAMISDGDEEDKTTKKKTISKLIAAGCKRGSQMQVDALI